MLTQCVYHYREPVALSLGLHELRKVGLTPRGLLFVALDPRGGTHLATPEDPDEATRVRVGDKLALEPPWSGRLFHFDAIHRLPPGGVLWNGDRRLAQPGSASEVALRIADWLKGTGARDVILGCTPHQPGSWWVRDDRAAAVALHDRGFVDVVTAPTGLLARRIDEPLLYYLPYGIFAAEGPLGSWAPVYESPIGNVLLLERRLLGGRLVLTCEHGLLEVDVTGVPTLRETGRVQLQPGLGVVGRIDGGAFAVTSGRVEPWGLAELAPALLVGAPGDTLKDLARILAARP